jgi:hypothetical protein
MKSSDKKPVSARKRTQAAQRDSGAAVEAQSSDGPVERKTPLKAPGESGSKPKKA